MLTDRGPELIGWDFTRHLAALRIAHHKTPPRSPNHNAVCERLHGTVLHKFFRVAFHQELFTSVDALDRQLQTWLDLGFTGGVYTSVHVDDYMRVATA